MLVCIRPYETATSHSVGKQQKEKSSSMHFYSRLIKKLTQNKSRDKHNQYPYFQNEV